MLTRIRIKNFKRFQDVDFDLVGVALFDRLNKTLQEETPLVEMMWQRSEVENYLTQEEVLLAYARHDQPDDLFGLAEAERRSQAMRETIAEVTAALMTLRRIEPWSGDIKASSDFLDPLFARYFEKLELPNLLRKSDYYVLAALVPAARIDAEVVAKLDAIVQVAERAQPREN